MELIEQATAQASVPDAELGDLRALIVDELRRLHEGVLARYGLRPSQFEAWKAGRHAG
jgi:hypothetical protein